MEQENKERIKDKGQRDVGRHGKKREGGGGEEAEREREMNQFTRGRERPGSGKFTTLNHL